MNSSHSKVKQIMQTEKTVGICNHHWHETCIFIRLNIIETCTANMSTEMPHTDRELLSKMVPPHEPLFSNLFFLLVLLSDEGTFNSTLCSKTHRVTYILGLVSTVVLSLLSHWHAITFPRWTDKLSQPLGPFKYLHCKQYIFIYMPWWAEETSEW